MKMLALGESRRVLGGQRRVLAAFCRVLGAGVLGALVLAPAAARAQQTHLVVITGVEGGQDYATQFHTWATTILDAAKKADPQADVVYLADKPATDPARITGRSTRETIQQTLTALATNSKPNDEVLIVLFGHGSFDGREAAFNLPGPDLSAADWGVLLDGFTGRRVAFVNTAASSGAFLEPLAGPGRAIVTATKTGGERNETIFPEYFAAAFGAPDTDQNRDGRVSIAEAFAYAKNKVEEDYGKKGTLLTEHATLEDGMDGQLAAQMFLTADRAREAAIGTETDPAIRALLEEQRQLEEQIAGLRLMKSSLPADEYDRRLEDLLTQLALKTREVAQRRGAK
jgi:hypothetical protein